MDEGCEGSGMNLDELETGAEFFLRGVYSKIFRTPTSHRIHVWYNYLHFTLKINQM